jgi:hypothetical protein
VNTCLITEVQFNGKKLCFVTFEGRLLFGKVPFVLFRQILRPDVSINSENHKRLNGGELSVH